MVLKHNTEYSFYIFAVDTETKAPNALTMYSLYTCKYEHGKKSNATSLYMTAVDEKFYISKRMYVFTLFACHAIDNDIETFISSTISNKEESA